MVEDDLRNKEGFIKVQEVQLKSLKKEFVSAEEKIEEFNNQKETSELVKYIRGSTQWAAKVNELTSEKKRLKKERFIVFVYK